MIYYLNKSFIMRREYGKTPNGNDLNGAWVLRSSRGFKDYDMYRNDLLARHNLKVVFTLGD